MTQLPSSEQLEATIKWLKSKSTDLVSVNDVEIPIQMLLDYVIEVNRALHTADDTAPRTESEKIINRTYGRHLPDEDRYETQNEIVSRVTEFFAPRSNY
jgi:hypothetical protein